jgi:hypothetical protein
MLNHKKLLCICASAALVTLAAQSQTTSTQSAKRPAPEPSSFEKFVQDAKKPTDWLSWGADFRARNEYYHEIVSLTESDDLHEQDVVRFRARLWTTAEIVTNLTFNGRISAEPRLWMKPSFTSAYKGQTGMEWRYGIADTLNVKWDMIFDQPLTLTAGRQDILIGDYYDWWLVADGSPADGSWTLFMDAIRLAWQAEPIKTRFDMMYLQQYAHPDEWIPTIGDAHYGDQATLNRTDYFLTEQNERGVVLYGSNKSVENMQIDGYFIYKHDDREDFDFKNVKRSPGDNGDIYTVGAKITGAIGDHWSYSGEAAHQRGQKEDRILGIDDTRDIQAYGAKARITYALKDKLNNQFGFAAEFLSGDDPDTEEDEMFDILWGRWPRWSELYIYSYAVETGGRIAQMNNIVRFGPQWSLTLAKGLTFSAAYNPLFAPQDTATRALNPGAFSGDGNFRGHYTQAVLKYQFNKHLNAHLWGEGVWQGNYYDNHDFMSFVRAEIMLTF